MSQGIIRAPQGALLASTDDNKGEPWKFTPPPVDCTTLGAMTEVIVMPLGRDAHQGRPALLRGEIFVAATIAYTPIPIVGPPGVDFLALDVQVDGYNGSMATTIARNSFGVGYGIFRVNFGESDTFDRIGISAVGNLNGQLGNVTLAGTAFGPGGSGTAFMTLQASLLMWR